MHRALPSSPFVLLSPSPSPPHSAGASIHPSAPSCMAITGGTVWNGTQQQNAYIIKWTHVQMELLSQPIKVNYQRQNAAAGEERGPCPENCIALMNNIISENGEETRSRTYQRKTGRGEARERERDGTQHWLPNYAFYHFSHNRVPPFFSCPVYSCSCSSAALMRKIKNNHTMLYLHLQPPNYFLLQHHIHTQSQSCEGHMCTAASFIFWFLFNVTM